MAQNVLKSNLFAFFMIDQSKEWQTGIKPELTFGYYDKSKYVGQLDWHKVKRRMFFGLRLDDIKVNGKHLKVC